MAPVRSIATHAEGQDLGLTQKGQHQIPSELTAIIEREGDGFAALCPEVDVASQGSTVQEAHANLEEAVGLFFETASASEILRRLSTEVYVTRVEVPVPSRKPNRG